MKLEYSSSVQRFWQRMLWSGSRSASVIITVIGKSNWPNNVAFLIIII